MDFQPQENLLSDTVNEYVSRSCRRRRGHRCRIDGHPVPNLGTFVS